MKRELFVSILGAIALSGCRQEAVEQPPIEPPAIGTAQAVEQCIQEFESEYFTSIRHACANSFAESLEFASLILDGGGAFQFSCSAETCEASEFSGVIENTSSGLVFTSFRLRAVGRGDELLFLKAFHNLWLEPGQTYEFSIPRRRFVSTVTRDSLEPDESGAEWSWRLDDGYGFRLIPAQGRFAPVDEADPAAADVPD